MRGWQLRLQFRQLSHRLLQWEYLSAREHAHGLWDRGRDLYGVRSNPGQRLCQRHVPVRDELGLCPRPAVCQWQLRVRCYQLSEWLLCQQRLSAREHTHSLWDRGRDLYGVRSDGG